MIDDDGYLSRNRPHLNRQQRERRARLVRIDYMPGADALAILDAKRAQVPAGTVEATNSAILDAILVEWAELTGIKSSEVHSPKTSAASLFGTGTRARTSSASERSARAQESGVATGISAGIAGARTGAYEFGSRQNAGAGKSCQRVVCGAKRHRDGQPCRAKSEPGKRRCKWHGGCSTGPKTPSGKAKALANLRQFR